MKIFISHDVDHLYSSDHIFRDLVFPKLWVRSSLHLLQGKINFFTWYYRLISIFNKKYNCIDELMAFDKEHHIPSVFFFGMDNILGMSYKRQEAKTYIEKVKKAGFDIGVHGVDFENYEKMETEFKNFQTLSGMDTFGIRMHYVRYDKDTFEKMSKIGYLFDTSEFNKKEIDFKPPYKVGKMWEFPLTIMDGYILKNGLEQAKIDTKEAIRKAQNNGFEYFTLLFHDTLFNIKTEPEGKAYYLWFVAYCEQMDLKFESYREAIKNFENTYYKLEVSTFF